MNIGSTPIDFYKNITLTDGLIIRMGSKLSESQSDNIILTPLINKQLCQEYITQDMYLLSSDQPQKVGRAEIMQTYADKTKILEYMTIDKWTKIFFDTNKSVINTICNSRPTILSKCEISAKSLHQKLLEKNLIQKDFLPDIFDDATGKQTQSIIKKYQIAKVGNIIVTYDPDIPSGKIAASDKIGSHKYELYDYVFTCYGGTYATHTSYFVPEKFMKNYLKQNVSFDCINYQRNNRRTVDISDYLYTNKCHGSLFYSSDLSLNWKTYYETYVDNLTVSTSMCDVIKINTPDRITSSYPDISSHNKVSVKMRITDHLGEYTDEFLTMSMQLNHLLANGSFDYYIYNETNRKSAYIYTTIADSLGYLFANKYIRVPTVDINRMNQSISKIDQMIGYFNKTGLITLLEKMFNDKDTVHISSNFISTYYDCFQTFVNKIETFEKKISDGADKRIKSFDLSTFEYGNSLISTLDSSKIIDYICYSIPTMVSSLIKNNEYTIHIRNCIMKQIYDMIQKISIDHLKIFTNVLSVEITDGPDLLTLLDITDSFVRNFAKELHSKNKKLFKRDEYGRLQKLNLQINKLSANDYPIEFLKLSKKMNLSIEDLISKYTEINLEELSREISKLYGGIIDITIGANQSTSITSLHIVKN